MVQSAVQPFPAVPGSLTEPEFVRSLRQEAWERYQALPLPKNEEEWRRTDLRGLNFDALPAYTAGTSGQVPGAVAALVPAGAPCLVQHNSTVADVTLPPDLARRGVILCSLEEAVQKHAALVEPYLMRGAFDLGANKVTALHAAKWAGGLFLYVPKGVEIDTPIFHFVWVDAAGAGVHTHSVIVAAEFSRVQIAAWRGSDVEAIVTEGVEIYTRAGAKVTYSQFQAWGPETTAFQFRRALPGQDSHVNWAIADFGGKLVRSEVETRAVGEGSQSDITTAFFGTAGQHLDLIASGVHDGSHSRSNILSRGAVGADARVVYRGRGQINPGARQASCYQREQALLLADNARHDAIPSLYVHETDVAGAGHAATSGRVDEIQLFYLQSRGISREVARRLVVEGFMAAVLDKFPELFRAEMQGIMDRKLKA